jgi:hypothetical protein
MVRSETLPATLSGPRLSIHPSVAPIDEAFTEKRLERQAKFTFIACRCCVPEA